MDDFDSKVNEIRYQLGTELKKMRAGERISQEALVKLADGRLNRITLFNAESGAMNSGINTYIIAAELMGYEIKFVKKENK